MISVTVQVEHMVTIDQEQETAYAESNVYVSDDVTWPRKLKVCDITKCQKGSSSNVRELRRRTIFNPRGSQDDEKVGDFAECQHRWAQYQAERSTDITQQSQGRVCRFILNVRVLQLREKHLAKNTK